MNRASDMDQAWSWVREALLALGLIVILLGAMVVMTGSTPPMVVVESGSMMHDSDGGVGFIDPGDIILVMSLERQTIITWAEATEEGGLNEGYRNHGMPGDVIIYRKNGGNDTPIIHRALLRAVANSTEPAAVPGECSSGVWDPTLEGPGYSGLCVITFDVPGTVIVNSSSISIDLDYPCHPHGTLSIRDWKPKHTGLLTTGDNAQTNGCQIDQMRAVRGSDSPHVGGSWGLIDENGQPVQAVRSDWVEGVAGPELPWFGAVKLAASANAGAVTQKSWNAIFITIAAFIAIPVVIDLGINRMLRSAPELKELSGVISAKSGTEENASDQSGESDSADLVDSTGSEE